VAVYSQRLLEALWAIGGTQTPPEPEYVPESGGNEDDEDE